MNDATLQYYLDGFELILRLPSLCHAPPSLITIIIIIRIITALSGESTQLQDTKYHHSFAKFCKFQLDDVSGAGTTMTMMKLCCSTAVIYSTSPGVAQGVADEEEEEVG